MERKKDGQSRVNGFLKVFIATILTLAVTVIAFVTINY